uniref:Transmembrane protein n=1 Tax=Davidia involucrata TaxID=16924 RepID=A0A5B6YTR4_DAVIN
MGQESVMNFVMEKLKELLLVLENFGGFLLGWLDKVFPPETRGEKVNHWLHVAAPFIISGVVLLMCICCCRCCCRGGRAVKMMKAPGRGYRMPRAPFESNPGSYFRSLRGRP